MLPDVAAETERAIRGDVFLSRRNPQRRDVLAETARRLNKLDDVTVREALGVTRALLNGWKREYLERSFDELDHVVADEPDAHIDLVALSESIVSELRAQGWTDVGLREAAEHAASETGRTPAAISALRRIVLRERSEFTCFVSVTLPREHPPFPEDEPTFTLVSGLPSDVVVGRAPKRGTQLRVKVDAFDATGAAHVAHRRVVSTIGALTVSLPASRIAVPSDVVGVLLPDGRLRGCEVQERLVEEKRTARRDEIVKILASSWQASSTPAADPLHDAIRLRHRALVASDPESRLLLLWSGIERLTSGARGFKAALTAARDLVSDAVTFGKLRRDVGDVTATIDHVVTDPEKRKSLLALVGGFAGGRIDRGKVLEHLLGDKLGDKAKLDQLLALFYDEQPLLAHRCHALWKDFGGDSPGRRGPLIAEYHKRSEERVAWQVGRIYRGRNRIAHVGVGPERVRDLVGHAHFYLTQLVAICVHYSGRPAQEVLFRRMGQYQAFIQLLMKGDSSCLTARALMRPSALVGGE